MSQESLIELTSKTSGAQADWYYEGTTSNAIGYNSLFPGVPYSFSAIKFYMNAFNHSNTTTWEYEITIDSEFKFTIVFIHE